MPNHHGTAVSIIYGNRIISRFRFVIGQVVQTSGHRTALVHVRPVPATGSVQQDGRGRRPLRSAAAELAAVPVPDSRAQRIRLFRAVAKQNRVGPEPGEPVHRPARIFVNRGDVAGPFHVRSDRAGPGRGRV